MNLQNAYMASSTVWKNLVDASHKATGAERIVISQLTKRAADLANDIKTLMDAVEGDAR